MKKQRGSGMTPPNCAGKRFAIIAARFYGKLSDALVGGARRALHDCGVRDEDVSLYEVPGCFEIPLACRRIIDADRFDGLVALGAVIQGRTPHFTYVAGECARGIMDVQLATGVPIGFGILTTATQEQAEERADPERGDKGYEAAFAAAVLTVTPSDLPRAGFR
ncbi:MAG TPA: 6,7-dimethyl-8-ribityllumazine synthase [Candidatus Tyrphobacter sp.]